LNQQSKDKRVEMERYQHSANLQPQYDAGVSVSGKTKIPKGLKAPLIYFVNKFSFISTSNYKVLEIGAGTGAYTGDLLKTGAEVVALDISNISLQVIKKRFSESVICVSVADMEALPFAPNTFDVVVSAGSLSYGDNQLVMDEVYRVLKPNGYFICLDSLNHNLIYRFNRWKHYQKGNRTISTLIRMPTLELIEKYRECFGEVEVNFFGAISWMLPLLHSVLGEARAATFSDWFDQWLNVKKSAFKFVMVARKIR